MCYGHGILGTVDICIGFITYSEEGVNHGERTDDQTWCAVVMMFWELLVFLWFFKCILKRVFITARERMIIHGVLWSWDCWNV